MLTTTDNVKIVDTAHRKNSHVLKFPHCLNSVLFLPYYSFVGNFYINHELIDLNCTGIEFLCQNSRGGLERNCDPKIVFHKVLLNYA